MIEADKKETIIVGYAFLEDESEEERAALQRRLEKTFGTDHLLYLAGDKEDVENAKKAGKSLGIYLAWTISRCLKKRIGSHTSGSFTRRRILSYVVRAFCSAARSS